MIYFLIISKINVYIYLDICNFFFLKALQLYKHETPQNLANCSADHALRSCYNYLKHWGWLLRPRAQELSIGRTCGPIRL